MNVDLRAMDITFDLGFPTLDVVADRYLPLLQQLLPPGLAWTRRPKALLTQLLSGLSWEFFRLERRGRDLWREAHPGMAVECLADWERVLGLPHCEPATSLQGRQAAAVAALVGMPTGPTPAFFKELAASLGYMVTLTTYQHSLFTCLSPCNAPLYSMKWKFMWKVSTKSGENDELLKCTLSFFAPLHTHLWIEFT